jgi:hypothetical protein
MRKLLVALVAVVVVLVVAVAAILLSGNLLPLVGSLFGPDHDFDPARAAPAPDYASETAWAALPSKVDEADLIPEGVGDPDEQRSAPADVFFIHPTGYLRGASWNSPIELESATGENTRWMLANQASAFNGCCRVHAPRYREATIFAFFDRDGRNGFPALDLAYRDVLRAFDHFIERMSDGRPFLIASHSQGTFHAQRLLEERIDGTALFDRMVAAYIIGAALPLDVFERSYRRITACEGATDLHCVISWDTIGEGGHRNRESLQWHDGRYERTKGKPTLCTNPLSWSRGEEKAAAALNRGAEPVAGLYIMEFWGPDEPRGIQYTKLDPPLPGHTWAQCLDGTLFVEEQLEEPFASYALGPGKNYHGLDYPLFYMDIRENAKARVRAYLESKPR